MKRREFIALLGGGAAWPLVARAQRTTTPVIGLLLSPSTRLSRDRLDAFRAGLGQSGYVEGRDVTLDVRSAEDHYDRLPELAADIVRAHPNLIVTIGNQQAALAAKRATATIPIVFGMGADPLSSGVVESLNRPGSNITGATQLAGPLYSKRLQLLHDLVPKERVFGVLSNPNNSVSDTITDELETAHGLGLSIENVEARSVDDLDSAFQRLAQRRVAALDIVPDTLFSSRPDLLAALAIKHSLPTIFYLKDFAKAGGLMSYGSDLIDTYRQTGIYAGRILKGESPAELPILQPTKFEFVINMTAAKALGLMVPDSLVALATEVIE